jgi:hypothetical protein
MRPFMRNIEDKSSANTTEDIMSEERRQILAMLAEKKITVDEAERLLNALNEPDDQRVSTTDALKASTLDAAKKKPKFLCVQVLPKNREGKRGEKINIKVPLFLLKTGLKLKGVLPEEVGEKIKAKLGEKGIDLNGLDEKSFDELVNGLTELSIDVDDEDEQVRICCE